MSGKYKVIYASDSLYHHGIKGQEWGHKNGPPYPLDKSDYSAAERKASTGNVSSGNSKSGKRINKETIKNVAIGVGVTAAVAGGAYFAIRNKDAVAAFIMSKKNVPISEFAKAKKSVINSGKNAVNDVMYATKNFVKDKKIQSDMEWTKKFYGKASDFVGPMPNVPKDKLRSFKIQSTTKDFLNKVVPGTGKAAVGGVVKGKNYYVERLAQGLAILGMKECTDIVLGKNLSGRAMKANDKDSIGKFWKYEEHSDKDK